MVELKEFLTLKDGFATVAFDQARFGVTQVACPGDARKSPWIHCGAELRVVGVLRPWAHFKGPVLVVQCKRCGFKGTLRMEVIPS